MQSFHPSNPKNLVKLFKAEEKEKHETLKKEELQREHAMEESRRHARSLMAERRGETRNEPPASMSFMYQKPPGMAEAQAKAEKAARPADRDAERFPLLKDAPRQGEYSLNIEVNHRPFGVELRKVRCSRCQQWGHRSGDRECTMRNELTLAEEARKDKLDPVARVYGSEASGAPLRWEIKGERGGSAMGVGTSGGDSNQQFVLDDSEVAGALGQGAASAVGLSDLDPQLLATLSAKQQKQLLKMYTQELQAMEEGGQGSGKKRKKEKKHKKEKHKSKKRRRERGAGSDGASGSDSDS